MLNEQFYKEDGVGRIAQRRDDHSAFDCRSSLDFCTDTAASTELNQDQVSVWTLDFRRIFGVFGETGKSQSSRGAPVVRPDFGREGKLVKYQGAPSEISPENTRVTLNH